MNTFYTEKIINKFAAVEECGQRSPHSLAEGLDVGCKTETRDKEELNDEARTEDKSAQSLYREKIRHLRILELIEYDLHNKHMLQWEDMENGSPVTCRRVQMGETDSRMEVNCTVPEPRSTSRMPNCVIVSVVVL